MTNSAIILAAGQGQRMKSALPKPLHAIGGVPMVKVVVDNVSTAGFDNIYLVIGHGGEQVQAVVPHIESVVQTKQLGTGHAVDQCRDVMAQVDGSVLITCADTPLFRTETFQEILAFHQEQQPAATVITAKLSNPAGYGRVVRDETGNFVEIVEDRDASPEQKQINEINTGTYYFDTKILFKYLARLTPDNAQAEYYLPDVLPLMMADGHNVAAFCLADPEESMGINNRVQLAQAEKVFQQRICQQHMLAGVTIINPDQTYIESGCEIGTDSIIYPNTYIQKGSKVGKNCIVGPNVRLDAAVLGDGVTIEQAIVVESSVGNETKIGPFAYIRPGSTIGSNCKIGDFVEVKNSKVGAGSKIPHLSYVGDAVVGSGVNIGCGVITCNYDGKKKHQTIIEDHSFIGSNSNLIAPVSVKSGAYVAAGSTITEDVPEDSLGIARSRQVNKEGWNKAEG